MERLFIWQIQINVNKRATKSVKSTLIAFPSLCKRSRAAKLRRLTSASIWLVSLISICFCALKSIILIIQYYPGARRYHRRPVHVDHSQADQSALGACNFPLCRQNGPPVKVSVQFWLGWLMDSPKITPFWTDANNTLPFSWTMGELYSQHKDADGFLYIAYSGENTFGQWTHCDWLILGTTTSTTTQKKILNSLKHTLFRLSHALNHTQHHMPS